MADHGGSLDRARALFPDAPEPWIDLSTGINPHAYPQLELPADVLTRLPEPGLAGRVEVIAAAAYGAAPGTVVAAPGTQILLPRVASLVDKGAASVLGPTYAEHIRACRLAGHDARYVAEFESLFDGRLAVVVNPNNPDGRLIERSRLIELARHLAARGGLLVVDEAFMETIEPTQSLAADVEDCGAVVLRSFGKFFGLAGVRLGFAIAPQTVAEKLRSELGPWAVSGIALHCGAVALADEDWQIAMRARLRSDAAGLDAVLARHGLTVRGGTSLFRYLETPRAGEVFTLLGRAGILTRRFDDRADALRIGLPAGDAELARLDAALAREAQAFQTLARSA